MGETKPAAGVCRASSCAALGWGHMGGELVNEQLPITRGLEALCAGITAPFIARTLPGSMKLLLPPGVFTKQESSNACGQKQQGFYSSPPPPALFFPLVPQSLAGR